MPAISNVIANTTEVASTAMRHAASPKLQVPHADQPHGSECLTRADPFA